MGIVRETNIARTTFFLMILVLSAMTFGVGAYFIVTQYELGSRDLLRQEAFLIDQQKESLRFDVERLHLRIELLSRTLQERHMEEFENVAEESEQTDESIGELLQEEVIKELGWADDLTEDTYFIYKLHDLAGGRDFATMLFNPARPDLVGDKLSTDFPDARGQDFRKVFMKDIRDRGQSFVTYWYNKSPLNESDEPDTGRKLAYFKLDPDWNWIIAKSVYLDPMDLFIKQRKEALKKGMLVDLAVLTIIFICSVVLAFFLAYSFSLGIHTLLKKHKDSEQKHLLKIETLAKAIEKRKKRDRLTGAYNRTYFDEELTKELARSDRYRTPLTIILFDVDHFRRMNEDLGRGAGDSILTELASLVKDHIRKTDILARWGSDEFVILAPGIELENGRLCAEKLKAVIEDASFSFTDTVTCCFGVSSYGPQENLEEFVQRTDKALREAKKRGRNSCAAL